MTDAADKVQQPVCGYVLYAGKFRYELAVAKIGKCEGGCFEITSFLLERHNIC